MDVFMQIYFLLEFLSSSSMQSTEGGVCEILFLFFFFLRIQALYKLLCCQISPPKSCSSNCPTMYALLKQTLSLAVHLSLALAEIWTQLLSHTLDNDSLCTKKVLLSLLLKLKDTELSFYLFMVWIIYGFQPSNGLFYQSCFSKVSGRLLTWTLNLYAR